VALLSGLAGASMDCHVIYVVQGMDVYFSRSLGTR
jgi:hypothetical protein